MVRLADLQDIIKTQTKLIQDLYHIIEDQKNMIENQATFIGYQTDLNEKLKMMLENSSIGKRLLYLKLKTSLNSYTKWIESVSNDILLILISHT